MLNDSGKPWYRSKGFLAPLTAAVLYALRATGIVDLNNDSAGALIYQMFEFSFIILGMIGRLLARQRIRCNSVDAALRTGGSLAVRSERNA